MTNSNPDLSIRRTTRPVTPAPSPIQRLLPTAVFKKFTAVAWTKTRWDDLWSFNRYLQPVNATEAMLPGQSKATFTYDYGEIKREDRSLFETYNTNRNIEDQYVAIMAVPADRAPYTLWVGIIPHQQMEIHNTRVAGGVAIPSGVQTVTAYGMQYILDRRSIEGAIVAGLYDKDGLGTVSTPITIGHTPSFNVSNRQSRIIGGNRSISKMLLDDGNATYGFGDLNEASFWSIRDIIEYLLFWSDNRNGQEPSFVSAGHTGMQSYLESTIKVVRHAGRSVLSIINGLIDRKRGMGAVLRFSHGSQDQNYLPVPGSLIELYMFSMTDTPITIGTVTFPKNTVRESVLLDNKIGQQSVVILDRTKTFDEIIVQGNLVQSCFSVATGLGTGDPDSPGAWPLHPDGETRFASVPALSDKRYVKIEPAWSPENQSIYLAGDDVARKDVLLNKVFREFRIPPKFNWISEAGDVLAPTFEDDGSMSSQLERFWWNGQQRFLGELPIQDPADVGEAEPNPKFLKPFVVFQILNDPKHIEKWVDSHDPGVFANIPSASLHASDRNMSFNIKISPAHYIAQNHFDGATRSNQKPRLDYNRMFATVALETDQRVTVRVRTNQGNGNKRLIIQIDDAHVWLVAPGTIMGVDASGGLRMYDGDLVVRDDTDRLRHVAALAAAWYSKPRLGLNLRFEGLYLFHEPGNFIETLSINNVTSEVGTVISERSWDFINMTTMIQTATIELDVSKL